MLKSIRLKLYPTEDQKILFEKNFGSVRFVYNRALALKIKIYERTGKSISKYDLIKKLPKLKEQFSWLKEVESQSLQQSILDLDRAYQNFFKHNKGFPKFKKKGLRDSFRCTVCLDSNDSHLRIAKHGWVKFKCSERDQNILNQTKIRNITVVKEAGQYYASCLIEMESRQVNQRYAICGIDLGVKKPVTLAYINNNGEELYTVSGKKFSKDLAVKERRRKRYQRQLARKQKGSNNRKKALFKVQRAFQRERNFRKNWIEQTSFKIASNFSVIKFEDLRVKNMTKSAKGSIEQPGKNVRAKSGLNREMLRLGLSQLVLRTEQKTKEFGGIVIYVPHKNTSRKCSCCGYIDKANRKSQATFYCLRCNHKENADVNAAFNILAA